MSLYIKPCMASIVPDGISVSISTFIQRHVDVVRVRGHGEYVFCE